MRDIHSLLDEYGESHQNRLNKLIHWLAVPAIFWSLVALLWSVPFPLPDDALQVPLNWAIILLLLAQVYWFKLSLRLGAGLLLYSLVTIQLTFVMAQTRPEPLWQLALVVFVAAWILQFIGHAVEGKRPSFFRDLQFLLIGPAWLMAALYRSLNLKI